MAEPGSFQFSGEYFSFQFSGEYFAFQFSGEYFAFQNSHNTMVIISCIKYPTQNQTHQPFPFMLAFVYKMSFQESRLAIPKYHFKFSFILFILQLNMFICSCMKVKENSLDIKPEPRSHAKLCIIFACH